MKNYVGCLTKYTDIIGCTLKELNLSILYHHIKRDGYKIHMDKSYNIFVKNKQKKNNILVVAHMDRVLDKKPRLFRYEDSPERLYGAYGWDDRAGIIAALELFKNNDIDLLFTTGEESGCIGAKAIKQEDISQYNVIFELDRHGSHDFVNDCSLGLLCNDWFTKEITYYIGTQGKTLKPTIGVYTDVGALRSINTTAQMFYMSCGYYYEHTENEYLIVEELESAIQTAQMIINHVNEIKITPFVPEVKPQAEDDEDYYYCPYCDDYCEKKLVRSDMICPYCRSSKVEEIGLQSGDCDDIIK